MSKFITPVQPLVITGADTKPSIPNPSTAMPGETGFNIQINLMIGQLAYNATDDIWYYRNDSGILPLLGGTVDVGDIEVWRDDKVYYADKSFVSYVNVSSSDPEFQVAQIYLCVTDTLVGESPETHESKWQRQGTTVTPTLPEPALTQDLDVTVTVGGVSAGSNYVIGDKHEQILRDMLAPYVQGSINSFSVGMTPSQSTYESGSTFVLGNGTFTYSADSNGDNPIDFVINGLGFTGTHQSSPITSSGATLTYTGIETKSWSIQATNATGGGSTNSRSYSRSSRYYGFYGTGSLPTNSAEVRALSGKSFLNASNNGSFTINIPVGETEIAFAVPAGKTATVLFRESSNADVTGSFTTTTFNVNDAGGVATSYDVYTSTLAGTGYPSVSNYDVTIN